VRLSIPLATLIAGGVQPGGTFYANLCRSIPPPNKGFLTWSPNFDDSFHVPERLGSSASTSLLGAVLGAAERVTPADLKQWKGPRSQSALQSLPW